ncbi:unnamed protein product, partial [Effrenium voratum]
MARHTRAPDFALKIGPWSCFCFCGADERLEEIEIVDTFPEDEQLLQLEQLERPLTPNDKLELEDKGRPDFSGEWKMVEAQGDWDTFLKEMGVGY